ncbi:zinc ribbon domain-containing protein [Desulfatiglans anilini]|uniref:zinc ribbon domain-containing protein n=1 Tax=Desulfatiglans anilini TaxID=90728 RepID=UPI0003FFC30C|nr:C4-type zinc ribbon domain-containing protein [Desulfatiglans anilini]
MEETIRLLIGLQDCDLRIRKIHQKRAEGPEIIKQLAEKASQAEAQLQETRQGLENAKKERRARENNLDDLRSKIQKSNLKLSNIKSNKEYTAVLKEIEDLKREKAIQEDGLIEIMEELERLEKECAAGEHRLDDAKKRYESDQAQILNELSELENDLSKLLQERKTFEGSIDATLLKHYTSLMNHRGGPAVSPVIKGVCQTCRLHIPPQKFNELIRGEAVMSCPNCHRIIYWGEDERFQGLMMDIS